MPLVAGDAVQQDADDPALEAGLGAKSSYAAPGLKKRLLRQILGQRPVPYDQVGGAAHQVAVLLYQPAKGFSLPRSALADRLGLVQQAPSPFAWPGMALPDV